MSKKQKAAGKATNKGKKAEVAAKNQKAKPAKSAPKSSKNASKKGGKKPAKVLKAIVTKAVKTVAKKALGSKSASSASSGKSGAKKGAVKKVIKAVKELVAKKTGKASPTKVSSSSGNKSDSGKAAKGGRPEIKQPQGKSGKQPQGIKALKPRQEVKKEPAKSLKPAVAVPAKPTKAPVIPAAVKASKNGQQAAQAAEKSKPAPAPAKSGQESGDKAGRKLNDLFVKKPIERKPNDVLAITNTIPVKTKNEISPSKIASISYAITNPSKRTDSYSVKPEKEPAGKFEMEFVVHASAEMLYEFLSTPSGLSEWFCDDLNIRNGIYTFIWDDQLQQARLLKTVDQQLVRFQWVDKTDGSYFEFRIQRDDLTNDISLIITDFADTASERESSKLLWNSQVEKLMHVIGSIF